MPFAPPTFKPHPHLKRTATTWKPSAIQRRIRGIRSSTAWRRFSHGFLRRNRYCVDPFGTHAKLKLTGLVPSRQTHHIIPLIDRPDLAFKRDNVAALCTQCQARVEAMERRGEVTRGMFGVSA